MGATLFYGAYVAFLYAYWHLLSHGPALVRADPLGPPVTPQALKEGRLAQAPLPHFVSWSAIAWTIATVASVVVAPAVFDSMQSTIAAESHYIAPAALSLLALRLALAAADSKETLVQESLGWWSYPHLHAKLTDWRAGAILSGLVRLVSAIFAWLADHLLPIGWHNSWAAWMASLRPPPLDSETHTALPIGFLLVWLLFFVMRCARYYATLAQRRRDALIYARRIGRPVSLVVEALNTLRKENIFPHGRRLLWLAASIVGAAVAVHASDVLCVASGITTSELFEMSWFWILLVAWSLLPLAGVLAIAFMHGFMAMARRGREEFKQRT